MPKILGDQHFECLISDTIPNTCKIVDDTNKHDAGMFATGVTISGKIKDIVTISPVNFTMQPSMGMQLLKVHEPRGKALEYLVEDGKLVIGK